MTLYAAVYDSSKADRSHSLVEHSTSNNKRKWQ